MNRARHTLVDGRTYWTTGSTPDGAAPDRVVRLLPVYDEYLVAYRDRDAVPHGPTAIRSRSGGFVAFQHALVIAGKVAGTWKTVRNAHGITIQVSPLRRLTRFERGAIVESVARYGRFLDVPASLRVV